MAEINVASQLSFGEIAKRTDGMGGLVEIFEGMNEENPVFPFIPAIPANHRFHQQVNRRTSLPTATWRKFYKGSATKASTTQVVNFPLGLLEILSEIDEDLVDTAEDPKGTRRQEDMAFVQGMQQQVMDAIISGTVTGAPEEIDGLQQYLNSLSQTMVFDGGNAGGTSIYVVDFSPQRTCLLFPPNTANRGPMGLSIMSNPTGDGNGKKWVTDDDGNDYLAYCTQFKWWVGLQVRDELSIGRIANINSTVGGSNTFDENDLIELLNYGRFNPRTTYILVCKEMKAQMQIRAKDKANVNFTTVNALSGEEVTMFGGYAPVMRCDSISTSESTVA